MSLTSNASEVFGVDLIHGQTELRIDDERHGSHHATVRLGHEHPRRGKGAVNIQPHAGGMRIHVALRHILIMLQSKGLLESVAVDGEPKVEALREPVLLEAMVS